MCTHHVHTLCQSAIMLLGMFLYDIIYAPFLAAVEVLLNTIPFSHSMYTLPLPIVEEGSVGYFVREHMHARTTPCMASST